MVDARPNRNAVIISIGDELLSGRTVDTNSHWLQQQLQRRGLRVESVLVVHDDADAIAAALDASPRGALVILTGGLGPTADDLTIAALRDWAQAPLVVDPRVEAHLRRRAADRKYPWGDNLIKQTLHPRGTRALINPLGTAPAVYGELKGRLLVVMPGVPAEMKALWPLVEVQLAEGGRLGAVAAQVLRRTVGLSEPELARRTEDLRLAHPDLSWSWWLTRWGVDVQASVDPTAGEGVPPSPEIAETLDRVLAGNVYARDLVDLHQVLLEELLRRKLTITAAESCTGGMINAALSEAPGASAVYRGGIVAYENAIKTSALDVPQELLVAHGAVSREVAIAMAVGARARIGADLSVAITGIAGPDGGTEEKPVGTTWIAWADQDGVQAEAYRFRAFRDRNRELGVAAALAGCLRRLGAPAGMRGAER